MNIKEYLEKIFVACTYYDKEITGKLGTEGEYEGSYEQAYDMLLKELDRKDKVIDLMAESWKQDDVRSVEEIKEYFYKQVEVEDE